MAKADLHNLKNEKVGEIELPATIFEASWKPVLVKQALTAQLANKRRPWAHAKDRSEVSGGGKKPWRQKGTGRARHGSIRSPLWIGGGKSHGPSKERDYSQSLNKKMRRAALFSLISKKFKDEKVKFFENLEIQNPKTKEVSASLKTILNMSPKAKNYNVLFVAGGNAKDFIKAARNLPKVKVLDGRSLNVYDLMNYGNIFFDKSAIEVISSHYSK